MINTVAVDTRIQFRSKSMIGYKQYHAIREVGAGNSSVLVAEFRQSQKHAANAARLRNRKKYTGTITKGAKKRLTKAVSLLVQSSERKYILNEVTGKQQYHQLSFITLTLPNVDQAKDAKFTHKHLLQPMLRILRSKYKMKSYVWKAELQSNGSIHYHLTTELFIPWHHLRQHWNALLRKEGLLDAFVKQYGHDSPNSVDVHSVAKINDMEAYLVKYISKEYQNEVALSGKVWDCSQNLKAMKYFNVSVTSEVHNIINREIDMGWVKPKYTDRCTLLLSTTTEYYLSFSQDLINQYYQYLKEVRTWQRKATTASYPITGTSSTASKSFTKPNIISPMGRYPGCEIRSLPRSKTCQMRISGIS